MPVEETFVMLKPDAVARGLVGRIVARFEAKGLKIKAMRLEMADPETVRKHYAVHEGKPFYKGLVEYILSGPVVPMIVAGENAVVACRALMGATNPAEGRPGEIRFDFAQEIGRNLVHGSDSLATARSEIALWFPRGGADYARGDDPYLHESA